MKLSFFDQFSATKGAICLCNIPHRPIVFLHACFIAGLIISLQGISHGVPASPVFEHSYEGDVHPSRALPRWFSHLVDSAGPELTAEQTLKVNTIEPSSRHHYRIDGENIVYFQGSSTSGSTIDFRVKVESTDPEAEGFTVMVGKEGGNWWIKFYPDKIQIGSQEFPTSTQDWDTYRIVIKDDLLNLYSATWGLMLADVPLGSGTPGDMLSFGSGIIYPVASNWELDFIRWTNNEAVLDPPQPAE